MALGQHCCGSCNRSHVFHGFRYIIFWPHYYIDLYIIYSITSPFKPMQIDPLRQVNTLSTLEALSPFETS
jgi:hypothetical protein